MEYGKLNNTLLGLLSDGAWHSTSEIEKECENSGFFLNGDRAPIYNAMFRLKRGGNVESDGKGNYRRKEKNIIEEPDECKVVVGGADEEDKRLEESIKIIEEYLAKHENFSWVTCSDKELQKTRLTAARLLTLALKIEKFAK